MGEAMNDAGWLWEGLYDSKSTIENPEEDLEDDDDDDDDDEKESCDVVDSDEDEDEDEEEVTSEES